MVAKTVDTFGRLDFAHNNAGVMGGSRPIVEMPDEVWQRGIGVMLTGVFYCMKHEIPAMIRGGGGAIVNTSSGAGLIGVPNQADYVAAKHGVIGLTKTAALENITKNVRINSICPGTARSRMVDGWLQGSRGGRDARSRACIRSAASPSPRRSPAPSAGSSRTTRPSSSGRRSPRTAATRFPERDRLAVLRDHRIPEPLHRVDLLLERGRRRIDVPDRRDAVGHADVFDLLEGRDGRERRIAGVDLEFLLVPAVFPPQRAELADHAHELLAARARGGPAVAEARRAAERGLRVAPDDQRHGLLGVGLSFSSPNWKCSPSYLK